jgi:hypothetical protein
MKIKKNLPIKYQIGAHRLCASYPDETDAIFEMTTYVMSSNKRKKSWKPDDFKFKMDDMKNIFPDIGNDDFKERIKTILSALHKNNDIRIAETEDATRVIAVTEQGLLKLYDI